MFKQAFKNIDDILHKETGCASELGSVDVSKKINQRVIAISNNE
jgi:hypothetical protein